MVTNKEIENNKNILPGYMGVSLAKVNNDDICSCVINGIVTNAFAKSDIAKHEQITVVPGGTSDEPYIVSAAVLIKGDYDGLPINVVVDEYGRLVLSEIDVQIGAVEIKNGETDDRALVSDANTPRIATDHVLEVQHLDASGKVQPAGEIVTNPIHVAIGDGVETIDVETVETDIDGKEAATTNSLIYGKESAGVTHPVKVDANGVLSVDDINAAEVATTPTLYNVTMTLADTEYSQALPANTKIVSFRCQDSGFDTRFAFVASKVATPTAPYRSLLAGEERTVEGLNLAATTLYFACGTAGKVFEIEAWT